MGADARLTADPGLDRRRRRCRAARCRRVRGVHERAPRGRARAAGARRRRRRVGRSSASASACRCCSTPARRTTAARGLGVIPGTVRWIPPGVKTPADAVEPARRPSRRRPDAGRARRRPVGVLRALAARCARRPVGRRGHRASTARRSNAAFRLGNVFATQFHPEKSGPTGLRLLANFVASAPRRPSPRHGRDRRSSTCIRRSTCAAVVSCACARATTTPRPSTATIRSRVAAAFADAGAPWVHVVDLDAARIGRPGQPAGRRPRSQRRSRGRARLQNGGGVRSLADAAALADAGVDRVVMGSAAVRDPELVAGR